MENRPHHALIIGGGPAGSTAATLLARAGKSVLLLEKEHFPRFHIGESLLPYNHRIFDEMGILPLLKAQNFPRKQGAQFYIGNGSRALQFVFRNGRFTREHEAFQVERARFDHLLLQHAAASGAQVREGWTVCRQIPMDEAIGIEARDPEGTIHRFEGAFLIDASGRSNLTGNQEGLRRIHPTLKKVALFGHFKNVKRDPGDKGGDTVIVRLENEWFWLIPLSPEKVSVGCVMDQEELVQARQPPEELFKGLWQGSPVLLERMDRAELEGKFQTTADFSYFNERLVGSRLLRAGDAAGFMDPIFSAGVYLAMYSGRLSARTILEALESGGKERLLRRYEKKVFDAMKFYWELVEQFYTTPFLEVFFSPREKWHIASAMNAALAGDLEGAWHLKWRLRLFFWLVRLQGKRPFLPRISFH
jgi:flavin-dependent dehydrogenase